MENLPISDYALLSGNFPQAFSHIGLVNAAWAITQGRRRADRSGPAVVAAAGRHLANGPDR